MPRAAADVPSPDTAEGDVNGSPQRQRWRNRLGPAAAGLVNADAEVFVHQSLSTPCLTALARAQGSWIEDVEGRGYLDFHGNSAHQVGYAHPRVVEAVTRQLARLPFCPRRYTNDAAVALARRLAALAPWGPQNTRVLLVPSGAAAVSLAVKIARLCTGRHATVSMWDSFHGATLDAIALGGEDMFRRGLGPIDAGSRHVSPCRPSACRLGCPGVCPGACADELITALRHPGDAAALVAEAVRCTTVDLPPADYWPRAQAACREAGTLLIFDEIPTGLGRTGRMFAFEHFGVTPDLIVLGKGLGGAVIPQAAVLVRADLPIPPASSVGHFTHEKSPLGAAAALATLDVIADEGLIERSRRLGDEAIARLRRWAAGHPAVREVRGLGLLIGIDLTRDGPAGADGAVEVLYACLDRGVSFKVSDGRVLTLTPPLNIPETDLWHALEVVMSSVDGLLAPRPTAPRERRGVTP